MLIYLASQSPRRKQILKSLHIPFKVVRSRYKERALKYHHPRKLALEHAVGKAKQAVVSQKARYILGADTVVYAGKKILGKPRNQREAIRMLQMISGRSHFVYTGVAIYDRISKKIWKGCEKTKVYVKKLSREEMERYIEKINPHDKAGGYAIQEKPKIVTKIVGSYSNVVGLPEELLKRLLLKAAVCCQWSVLRRRRQSFKKLSTSYCLSFFQIFPS